MKNKDWEKEIPWNEYEWAEYAALNHDGTMKLFRDEPICMDAYKEKFWFHRYSENTYARREDLKGHKEYIKLLKQEKAYLFKIEWSSNNLFEYDGDWRKTLVKRKDK